MQASRPGTPLPGRVPGKAERRCRASASSSVRWDNSTSFLVGLKYICLCQTVTNTEPLEVFPRQGWPRALGEGQPPPEKGVICRSPTARTRLHTLKPSAHTGRHLCTPCGSSRRPLAFSARQGPSRSDPACRLLASLADLGSYSSCSPAALRHPGYLHGCSQPPTAASSNHLGPGDQAQCPPADAQLRWAHTHFWRPPTSREDRLAQRHGDPRGSAGSVRPDTHQEM